MLEHVTLSFAVGDKTALVGRNGAGKTTLSPLLMRNWKKDVKVSSKKMVLPIQANSAEAMLYGHAGCKSSAFYGERFRGSPVKYAGERFR